MPFIKASSPGSRLPQRFKYSWWSLVTKRWRSYSLLVFCRVTTFFSCPISHPRDINCLSDSIYESFKPSALLKKVLQAGSRFNRNASSRKTILQPIAWKRISWDIYPALHLATYYSKTKVEEILYHSLRVVVGLLWTICSNYPISVCFRQHRFIYHFFYIYILFIHSIIHLLNHGTHGNSVPMSILITIQY